MNFSIHHIAQTASTNTLAQSGKPGDVFWADTQIAGRGRLNHSWMSVSGESLTFSVVFDCAGIDIASVVTFPIAAGLAVTDFLREKGMDAKIKWPNDILVGGRKICGILCELAGGNIICGIGINFNQSDFPAEISQRATSIFLETGKKINVSPKRVLHWLGKRIDTWKCSALSELWPEISKLDVLNGQHVKILKTDVDTTPVCGLCGGIQKDGTLLVDGVSIPAGEAHILR